MNTAVILDPKVEQELISKNRPPGFDFRCFVIHVRETSEYLRSIMDTTIGSARVYSRDPAAAYQFESLEDALHMFFAIEGGEYPQEVGILYESPTQITYVYPGITWKQSTGPKTLQ